MYPSMKSPSTDELSPLAEEIRAYLVDARGGAPFLSAADAQLLLDWLDARVPVPLIIASIDRVAARRRKKRVRSRLTLSACRGEVRKALKRQAARNSAGLVLSDPEPARTPTSHHHIRALRELIKELEDTEVDSELRTTWTTLIETLRELSHHESSLDDCTRSAMSAIRIFHRDAWDAMSAHHSSLRDAAREELASLQGAVSDRIFLELLEEAARDQLRRRHLLVSADRLWDRLQP
jgi:hypothetical protein